MDMALYKLELIIFYGVVIKCRPSHVDISPSNPLIHSVNNYFQIPPFDDPEYYYDHLASSETIQRRLSVGLSQGYHNCYIWDFNSLSGIYERNLDSSTLVKFTDIKTDYLYVTINYSEPLAWTDVYSFVTFDYIMDWTSNPHIQKWMSWLNSSYAYLEKIMKIKKKKGVGTMLDVKINVYSQKTAKRMTKIFSRQVLLNNMERQEPVPDEFEEKKFLRSNKGCYKEIVSFGSDKFFFDVGLPDEVASSDILCHMRGFPPKAKAKCSGNFVFGYSWVLNELLDCASFNINEADESSNLTKSFYDILHKDMKDYDDLLEMTKDLLTKDPTGSTVQSKDISLVAAILEKSNSTDFHMSTDHRILNSMETLVKKLSEVSQDINVTWSGKNLVTHFYETSVHNHSMGFALLKLKVGNKSEKYIYGGGVLEAGGDNLDEDLEVALLIPDEIYRRKSPLEGDFPVKTSLIVYKTATLFQSSMTSSSPLSSAKRSAGLNSSSLDENGKDPADDDGCEDVVNRKINSLIIKSSVGGRKISNLKKKNTISNPACVYAKYKNDRIEWSTDGLETIDSNVEDFYIECESDHLTNFAVLAVRNYSSFSVTVRKKGFEKDLHSKKVGIALQWVSMIGMIISIVCLSLVIIGQIIFKKFRKGQYHIALLNLSISLICVNLIIMFGLDKKPPSPPLSSSSCTSSSTSSISRKTIGCLVKSALLHYFLLVSFSWMLIEAILQYLKFVKVFNTHISSFVWKTMLPAWILPAIVVIVTGSVDYRLFDGFKHHCWLAKKAFYLAFLLPLGFIILANIVVFMRVIKGISCDRPKGMVTNQSQCKLIWLQVQVALCCFVIMGLTWSFAFFAYGDASVVMYFLFAIFNSLQGLFIFLLFNLREKPVRHAWSSFVRKPAKHLPFSTSSTGATAPNTSKFTPNKLVDKDKKKALSTELDFLNATSSGRSLDDAEKNNLKKRSGSDGKGEEHVNTFSKSN
ncbi:hypothetical protein HELRODRAFT_178980 [Helobdella robusta]|uniref:G-protein coupled receptors family 2 profile 2 domain-containing protein n=1 Tax=Helobdella robusta TaxID=6412 RepID=T1FE02_HELRO|nr:hypothetical protein HELRODRAFT_178980 [Helobdella robusta]ESN95797.1 hypothetical protein HELRODRAFT_178980 [Helobdella robusta]